MTCQCKGNKNGRNLVQASKAGEQASDLSCLVRKSHGQKNLEGYSPQGHKEPDVTE